MARYCRWDDVKKLRREPAPDTRTEVEHDLAPRQLIYDLRTEAGLSQRQLAERMGTTQSVISRLEEGGGARNRIDALAGTPRHSAGTSSCRSPKRSPPSSRTPCRSLELGRRNRGRREPDWGDMSMSSATTVPCRGRRTR